MKRQWLGEDDEKIDRLVKEGHSLHCSCRIVWGDGECECNQRGTPRGDILKKLADKIREEFWK